MGNLFLKGDGGYPVHWDLFFVAVGIGNGEDALRKADEGGFTLYVVDGEGNGLSIYK